MTTSRKDKAKALNHLPTYLGLAYEMLQLGSRISAGSNTAIEKILDEIAESNKEEEVEIKQSIFLIKMQVMDHLESQHRRVRENIQTYTKAKEDYIRLTEGVGTKDELDAFKTLFGNHQGYKG